MSNDYKPGDTAFYHEMGEVLKVQVLENNSTEKEQSYKLKILAVVQESRVVKPSKIGEEFEAWALKNAGHGGWHMGSS